MTPNITTFVLSIIGVLTGTTGTVLSILNYLRDRASAVVTLQWDFVGLDACGQTTSTPMGVVSITNQGRRPLYIKLVYLDVPKRSGKGLRRLIPPGDAPRLSPIRSLACFRPVIDELRIHRAPEGYLDYLRLELRQAPAALPADVQKSTKNA